MSDDPKPVEPFDDLPEVRRVAALAELGRNLALRSDAIRQPSAYHG